MSADRLELGVDDAAVAHPPARSVARARWVARLGELRDRVAPLLPFVRTAGFVAAVAIVVYVGVHAARQVKPSELDWWPLPFAVLAAGLWWMLLGRGWSVIVSDRLTRSDLSVWCRTQALRFIPGGLWAPASRVTVVRGGGMEKLSAVAAENIAALCAALTVGGVALGLAGRFVWLALALAIALPPLAARLVAGRTRITPSRSVRLTGNYLVGFVAYALAAVLVQAAVSGFSHPMAVAGAATVAWAAGLVVVIAPSGVGVREVVYIWFLSGTLPSGELAAGAVTMRLVMVLAEFAVLVLAGRPVAAPAPESASADSPA